MIQFFYQHLPQYVNPIAFTIGSFSVRWYALSYIVGFAVVYMSLLWRIKKGELKMVQGKKVAGDLVADFLLLSFLLAMIGGRIGFVLFYDPAYFFAHPTAIVSPFDPNGGELVGLFGMSYHGALLGVVFSFWYFCKKNKLSFWNWVDFVIPAIPLGYFFGRIGNFLNGELYGRLTDSWTGMYFLQDPSHLRFPSQLFEAATEGLILFFILWSIRNQKKIVGLLGVYYIIGYGTLRFLAEFFREPDPQIGFMFKLFSMGQLLSLCMIVAGIILWRTFKKDKMMIY